VPFFSYLTVVLLAVSGVFAQNISSTIKGTVQDQSGAFVPGAECLFTNAATAAGTVVTSAANGSFVFLNVQAGTYTVSIRAKGFKLQRLENVNVTASEFHPLGSISLAVGETYESVIVSEKAPPVQTSSGERSDLVTGSQLNDLAV